MDIGGLIVQLITAAGGTAVLTAILTARSTRKKIANEAEKVGADAASILSASAIGLLEPMNKQIDILEERLGRVSTELIDVEKKLRDAERRNDELQREVRELLVEVRDYRSGRRLPNVPPP